MPKVQVQPKGDQPLEVQIIRDLIPIVGIQTLRAHTNTRTDKH